MRTVSPNTLVEDFATVTPNGIFYRNIYYTCSRAIKEKWFEIAQRNNSWNLRVKYIPTDIKVIYIQTKSKELEECRAVVQKLFEGYELETYKQSVQLMKMAKRILKTDN